MNNQLVQNNIEIYQSSNGEIEFKGDLKNETIWATQKQLSQLFGTKIPAINKHIKNILEEEELTDSTISKMETVQIEGTRKVQRLVEFYSLDMIIAIGYRVNSKMATQFRKWSTSILKQYLLRGYAINEKKIAHTEDILSNLKKTINLLTTKNIGEEKEILNLLHSYTKTLSLLEYYDKSSIDDFDGKSNEYYLSYEETRNVLKQVKKELIKKGEATEFFANEKDNQLAGIIGNLYQTFCGAELYPSIEDKASHLLYFIIKDHPFCDGNKRSASFLFVYFLDKSNYLCKTNGEKKINENALTALALLVASSDPTDKDVLVKLIKHLIFENNEENKV